MAGRDVIALAGRLGGWLGEIVGKVPEDAVGLYGGDALHYRRLTNLSTLKDAYEAHVAKIAADRRTEASPSVVMPLLEAAQDEGRPELQAIWAALLANATIDNGRKVRRDFFNVVRKLEPIDAVVLRLVWHRGEWAAPPVNHASGWPDGNDKLVATAKTRGIAENNLAMALDALERLGCIGRIVADGPPVIRPVGEGLLLACIVD
jgi:hypothetical protein